MPPTNPARRRALTDAVIALLAAEGVHGVTHRAVEKATGLPSGTASNYFRSREALLIAAGERIVELHRADTAPPTGGGRELTERLAESLYIAATVHRDRYRAIFELQLEAGRRPALAAVLAELAEGSVPLLVAEHANAHGQTLSPETVRILMTLYGGALYTLATTPPEHVDRPSVDALARAIVRGALAE